MTDPDHQRTARGRRALRRAAARRQAKRDQGKERLPDPAHTTTMRIPDTIRRLQK